MNEKKIMLRQPYAVTLAKHRLNVHEMRIMFRVIEALQPDVRYSKSIKEVGKTIFGNKVIQLRTKYLLPKGSQNYSCVQRAVKSLRRKDITIQGKDAKRGEYIIYTGLILKGKYFCNNEFVEIELDKDILPCFLALAKNYSKYLLEVAFNASSPNVMKLYQYISNHYWKKELSVNMDIEELRDWLQIGDKYSNPYNFRLRILEPAIKELKEKADVYFEIKEPIRLGRQITGWKIMIFKKPTSDEELQKASRLEQDIRFYLTDHFKLKPIDIASLEKYIRSPEWQPHIWSAMHRVDKRLMTTDKNKKIGNKRAYMLKAIMNELEDSKP